MKEDNGVLLDKAGSRLSRRTILQAAAATGAAVDARRRHEALDLRRPGLSPGHDDRLRDDERRRSPRSSPCSTSTPRPTTSRSRSQANPFASLLEKLTINLTQATGAYDVVSMDDPWMPQFAGGEFLMNLGELMDQRGMQPDEDFIPELLALGDFPAGSGLRGIPWVGNVQVFAWRTDVLEELGLGGAEDLGRGPGRRAGDHRRQGRRGALRHRSARQAGNPAATSFLPVLRGYGTDLFDENWEPQLETPQAMAAMTTQLALAKLAPPGVENVDHAENGSNMYQGLTAQSADIWPDLLLQIYDPELSKVVGMVEIGGEPAQEGVKPANMTGNWLLGIPEGSQNAEAALDFILWFTAPEQQKRLLLEQNIPATRISVMEDPEAVEQAAVPAGSAGGRPQRAAAAADAALQRGRGDLRPLRRGGDRRPDQRRGRAGEREPRSAT